MIELMGFLASVVVLISLMMKRMVMLRLINSVGAILFIIYAAIIGSPSVVFVNVGIFFVNLYYLWRMRNENN